MSLCCPGKLTKLDQVSQYFEYLLGILASTFFFDKNIKSAKICSKCLRIVQKQNLVLLNKENTAFDQILVDFEQILAFLNTKKLQKISSKANHSHFGQILALLNKEDFAFEQILVFLMFLSKKKGG